MKRFLLTVRYPHAEPPNANAEVEADRQKRLVSYVELLKDRGSLLHSQPLNGEGLIISRAERGWQLTQIQPDQEVNVGMFLINASDMSDALTLARLNPELEYVQGSSIEVREISFDPSNELYFMPCENTEAHVVGASATTNSVPH